MFADDKCLYLTFIVKGGGYNPVNKKIKKHEVLPMFSNDRVCIRSCGAGKVSKLIYNIYIVVFLTRVWLYIYMFVCRRRLGIGHHHDCPESGVQRGHQIGEIGWKLRCAPGWKSRLWRPSQHGHQWFQEDLDEIARILQDQRRRVVSVRIIL